MKNNNKKWNKDKFKDKMAKMKNNQKQRLFNYSRCNKKLLTKNTYKDLKMKLIVYLKSSTQIHLLLKAYKFFNYFYEKKKKIKKIKDDYYLAFHPNPVIDG